MSGTRALAWKEWKEQQPVVIAALLVCVAMPVVLVAGTAATGAGPDLPELSDLMPGILALLVWPLFAAAAGGATIATELGEGTLGFLLSRPVSRARIWWVKIAIGVASMLLILAGSLVVVQIFGRVARPEQGWLSLPTILSTEVLTQAVPASITATGLLFCTSVFFSTFLSRAMNAAAAGLAAALAMIAGMFVVWSRLDIIPRLEPGLFVLELGLAGAAFLLGSLYLFCRGELLAGRGAKKRAVMVLGIAMALLAAAAIPALWAQARLSPSDAMLAEYSLNGAGDMLVATALSRKGMSPEVWMIPTDGAGLSRAAGRLTFSPVFSPDGKKLAYLSLRGVLGLRSDDAGIRIMDADGSHDTLLTSIKGNTFMAGNAVALAFSPDGSRVALTDGLHLLIAPLQGNGPTRVDLMGTPVSGGRLVGWAREGAEVLLLASTWKPATTTLAAVGVRDGAIRLIHHQIPGRTFFPFGWRQDRSWKTIPLLTDSDPQASGGFDLNLTDVENGATTPIASGVCAGAADLSEDGSLLAYATCPRTTAGMKSSIHLMDRNTREDRVIGQIDGKAWRILISPTRDQLLIHRLRPAGGALPTVIVDTRGSTRELQAGWIPVGWQGRQRVVLADDARSPRLSVADVSTGDVRVFYPTAR